MNVYMHSKDDLGKNVLKYIACLIPLYLYGIYKNGILVYQKNLISIFSIFKLLYLSIIGLVIYIVVNLLFKSKLKLDLEFLIVLIIPLFMPPEIKYYLYAGGFFVGMFISKLLSKLVHINRLAFIKLLIILLVILVSNYSYQNLTEEMNIYSFSYLDIIWGRNVSGLGISSIALGLIIMVILSFTKIYKPMISLSALITFTIPTIIFKDYNLLLCASAILTIILMASDSISSPVGNISKLIYGILIGGLGYVFTKYVSLHEGMTISILICSFLYGIICKITKKIL